MKRGYLLPHGCKDLHDVLLLKQKHALSMFPHAPDSPVALSASTYTSLKPWKLAPALPPVTGEIVIPSHTTVKMLATLLGRKPHEIVADIMQLGMLATPDNLLDFDTISRIARKYGLTAIRAAL